ncbi:hypothetical protein JCM1840_005746 [Sporobolomyces johnsonii]
MSSLSDKKIEDAKPAKAAAQPPDKLFHVCPDPDAAALIQKLEKLHAALRKQPTPVRSLKQIQEDIDLYYHRAEAFLETMYYGKRRRTLPHRQWETKFVEGQPWQQTPAEPEKGNKALDWARKIFVVHRPVPMTRITEVPEDSHSMSLSRLHIPSIGSSSVEVEYIEPPRSNGSTLKLIYRDLWSVPKGVKATKAFKEVQSASRFDVHWLVPERGPLAGAGDTDIGAYSFCTAEAYKQKMHWTGRHVLFTEAKLKGGS